VGALGVLSCADSPSTPTPDPIQITVTGVEDGARYDAAVQIEISTSRGTYSAELDGELFLSGQTVAEVGAHTLEVTARDQGDVATLSLDFEIVFEGTSTLIVRVFDLGDNEAGGGGDAILVTDSAQGLQLHALFDAGPAGAEGARPGHVADRLQDLGVTALEALILTHAHSDHFSGMPAVLSSVEVDRFIYNGQDRDLGIYQQVIEDAMARADTVIIPGSVVSIPLSGPGGTEIGIIPPLDRYLDDPDAGSSELNEGSLGALVHRGAFEMFLAGDGEVEANARWRTDFGSLSEDIEVLKVGHHGANDAIFDAGISGSSSWLDHTSPEILLISANGLTHPRENALAAMLSVTDRTYCTNVHGDVELRVDPDGEIRVTVEKNAARTCEAGSEANS
jgi:beta-lactamase superfamily II metal-dependent hydrolase